MNCAAVEVQGGQDNLDFLPDMFIANLQGFRSCKTNKRFNTRFPRPGRYTLNATQLFFPLMLPSECDNTTIPVSQAVAGSPSNNSVLQEGVSIEDALNIVYLSSWAEEIRSRYIILRCSKPFGFISPRVLLPIVIRIGMAG